MRCFISNGPQSQLWTTTNNEHGSWCLRFDKTHLYVVFLLSQGLLKQVLLAHFIDKNPGLKEVTQIESLLFISFQIHFPANQWESIEYLEASQGSLKAWSALPGSDFGGVRAVLYIFSWLLLARNCHFYVVTVHSHLCLRRKSMSIQNSSSIRRIEQSLL